MQQKIWQSEQELLNYARTLAGLTLAQVANQLAVSIPAHIHQAKGWVGQLIERFLGCRSGNLAQPDFPELAIELKTLPLNAHGQPRETTYVTTIPLQTAEQDWTSSVVYQKLRRVLWVPYEADSSLALAERRLGLPLLWSPSEQQMAVLKQDWQECMELVQTGQIASISSRLGQYLHVRPKAAHGKVLSWSTDQQGQRQQTLPRGFYLRTSLTKQIIRDAWAPPSDTD